MGFGDRGNFYFILDTLMWRRPSGLRLDPEGGAQLPVAGRRALQPADHRSALEPAVGLEILRAPPFHEN